MLERDERVDLVGTAQNAGDGIDLAVAHKADVVLMDVSMPGLDGLEATRRLRAIRPETEVVILSGLDADDVRRRARDAGAAAVLTKGGILEDVVDTILSSLGGEDADDLAGRDSLTGTD